MLLILYLCALHKRGLITSNPTSNIETAVQCVYIQDKHPFKEVEEFVATSIKTYSLSLLEYAKPMKEAFTDYLRDTPSVKAILVGTRRTDPHGEHLKHFDPTDKGWPAFVRVHPVIDWHYVDIWTVSDPWRPYTTYMLIEAVYTIPEHTILPTLRPRIYLLGRDYGYPPKSRARTAAFDESSTTSKPIEWHTKTEVQARIRTRR